MTTPHDFDEALISGYLDGELTQGEAQRVRVHLEDCVECRKTADRLGQIKEATIGIVWFVTMVGVVLWQVATEAEDPWEVVLVVGFWLAAGLVLLSVLIDRLQTRKNDPYRRIQK